MIKGILTFVLMWAAVAASIVVFRHMTLREKFETAKLLAWSGLYAVIALGLLTLAVIVF